MRDRPQVSVAIVNFHFAHNHGAVLQALALQDRLSALGCAVQTIDYQPRGHSQQYSAAPNPVVSAWWKYSGSRATGIGFGESVMRGLKRGARAMLQWSDYTRRRARGQVFKQYIASHMSLTRRYRSLRALRKYPPDADLYLSGSDQIWNPSNTGGLDPVYFLDFGPRMGVRASYAASPCQLDVNLHRDELTSLTGRMDFISLRESEQAADIEDLSGKPVSVVPDPVILMTADDFAPYRDEVALPTSQYVVIYAVRTKASVAVVGRIVQELLRKGPFEVVDLSLDASDWPFEVTRPDCLSPGAFVSYIASSSFVVSNSFHATAFSLLFERDFVVATESGTAQRLDELLNMTGLSHRAVASESAGHPPLDAIDYETARQKLESLRTHGLRYLQSLVSASELRRDRSSSM